MKIAIINDTHYGIRNASNIFLEYQNRFFQNLFFPEIEKRNITEIIHLGDFFDNRKQIDLKTFKSAKENFLNILKKKKLSLHIIPGNHDVVFKNTNELNSLQELLYPYKNINIYLKPQELNFAGVKILFLPWITGDNYDICMDAIAQSSAPVLAAHLELEGFPMLYEYNIRSEGMPLNFFSKFEIVLSGHYHTKSSKNNIHYLGTQIEFTWGDCGDKKYFHIFDTETRELEAIENTENIFQKIIYDNESDVPLEIASKKFVRVLVLNRSDANKFDNFLEDLNKQNPFDVKISYQMNLNVLDQDLINMTTEEAASEDTYTLINNYVNAIDTTLDKNRLKKKLSELLIEAQSAEIL